jgi:hypothetical protein
MIGPADSHSLPGGTKERAMRSLVVYHSHSGNTRRVAERVGQDLGADMIEVRSTRYGPGVVSYVRAAFDSWRGRLPEIEVSGGSPEQYDFVMLLAPVWAGHASTPLRAYLAQNRSKFKRAAFVLTCGGHCPPTAFDEMGTLSGVKPEMTFVLREQDIKSGGVVPPALSSFLSSIKLRQAA